MGVRGQPTKWDKWYSTARWARIRQHQLREHPLCKYCLERAIVTPATICDQVEPHTGDPNQFWLGTFMSLCKGFHNSTKRFVELHGFRLMASMAGRSIQIIRPIERGDGVCHCSSATCGCSRPGLRIRGQQPWLCATRFASQAGCPML